MVTVHVSCVHILDGFVLRGQLYKISPPAKLEVLSPVTQHQTDCLCLLWTASDTGLSSEVYSMSSVAYTMSSGVYSISSGVYNVPFVVYNVSIVVYRMSSGVYTMSIGGP